MTTKRCDCGTCPPCRGRAANRRHYQRNAEAVKARVAARVQAKREAGERYWQDAETKAQKRYRKAMDSGKAPASGRFALHDGHVKARTAWVARMDQQSLKAEMHDAHVKLWRKARSTDAWRHRYRTDPDFNVKERVRAALRKKGEDVLRLVRDLSPCVKRGKWKAEWIEALGYDLPDLVRHLELTLPRGFTWHDFLEGELHIDHIVPKRTTP